MSRYDKQYQWRDQGRAEEIEREFDCSGYTQKHLENALRFARGCAGSESLARQKKLLAEIKRRNQPNTTK